MSNDAELNTSQNSLNWTKCKTSSSSLLFLQYALYLLMGSDSWRVMSTTWKDWIVLICVHWFAQLKIQSYPLDWGNLLASNWERDDPNSIVHTPLDQLEIIENGNLSTNLTWSDDTRTNPNPKYNANWNLVDVNSLNSSQATLLIPTALVINFRLA